MIGQCDINAGDCVVVCSVGLKQRQLARRVLVILVSVWPHYFGQ